MTLKITKKAKDAAMKALAQNARRRRTQRAGTPVGKAMAVKIIKTERLSIRDAKRVASFHARFRRYRTKKAMIAKGLWGGSSFGETAARYVRSLKK